MPLPSAAVPLFALTESVLFSCLRPERPTTDETGVDIEKSSLVSLANFESVRKWLVEDFCKSIRAGGEIRDVWGLVFAL